MMTIASDNVFDNMHVFSKALVSDENMNQLGLGRLAKRM